jgi:hypothetical protein
MGLAKLPSSAWTVNCGWILAANLAADIDAWTRLLGLHDHDDLNQAEPDTLRYRVWHLPAKLTCHARTRTLAISREWPWREAFLTCWNRLTSLPAPARRADHHRDNEEGHPHLRPPMVNTTSCCMHWPRSRTRVTHAGVRYPLAGLLTMAVCAVLAGPHRSPRSATGCTIWTPMPDPVWDSPVEYRWARRCDGC